MKLADTKRSEVIRRFLLNYIKAKNPHMIQDAMEAFGITRQTVHHHLSELVDKGFLLAEGNTRGRVYRLGQNRSQKSVFLLNGLSESDVYYREFERFCPRNWKIFVITVLPKCSTTPSTIPAAKR